MHSINYVGLDVHKTTIAVAVAKCGRSRFSNWAHFANRADVVRKMAERLSDGGGLPTLAP